MAAERPVVVQAPRLNGAAVTVSAERGQRVTTGAKLEATKQNRLNQRLTELEGGKLSMNMQYTLTRRPE